MSTKICKNCGSYRIKSSADMGGLAVSNYGFCELHKKPVDFWSSCAMVDMRGDKSSENIR